MDSAAAATASTDDTTHQQPAAPTAAGAAKRPGPGLSMETLYLHDLQTNLESAASKKVG